MATELTQHDAASTLMYGALAAPGSPALMFTWELERASDCTRGKADLIT
jgi:hypothetical protein